jgi:DNA-binding NarL/FixJ family response regulator
MRDTSCVPPGQGPSAPDGVRIVIADDDRMFARMVRDRLSEVEDVEVVGIANDGREAIHLADTLRPDVVLMDVNMPRLDGIEATRRIHELPNEIAVVLITGEDAASDARAYEAGAAAYLRKSIGLVALMDVIVAVSQLVGA